MKNKSHKPLFITLEGVDGSGKTTQLMPLAYWLENFLHRQVIITHEPYGQVSVQKFATPRDEYEWYIFDRCHHVDELIQPALNQGKIVLCDRYLDSTFAYQYYAKRALSLEKFVYDCKRYRWPVPDYTILFDCYAPTAMERIMRREGERGFTEDERVFLQKVITGYRLASEEEIYNSKSRFLFLDTDGKSARDVYEEIKSRLTERLKQDGFTETP